jgi:hypothetical protein
MSHIPKEHRFSASKKRATVHFRLPGVGATTVQESTEGSPALRKAIQVAWDAFNKQYQYGKEERANELEERV